MRRTRLVTLAGDARREPEVAAAISAEPTLELVLRCVDRVEALAAIRGGSLDLVLAVGPTPWFDFQCVEEARRSGVRAAGIAGDPVEVEMLEVAGFEVVASGMQMSALVQALEDASSPGPPAAPRADRNGRLVAVWGAKGAPGRTSIAIELAAILAETEPDTSLVDADLHGGDVAQLLGIVEELPGIVPIARRGARGELRHPGWTEELRRVGRSGPVVIPGLLRADLWQEVSAFGWEAILESCRASFRFTVVDAGFCLESDLAGVAVGAERHAVARATIRGSDRVVAIVRADPVGIKSFLWSLSDGRELELEDKLVVVLNRVRPGEARELRDLLRRHLARPPVAFVPERPELFTRAVWAGEPVAGLEPGSDVCEQIRVLATALGATMPPRGFLARLAGRGAHV